MLPFASLLLPYTRLGDVRGRQRHRTWLRRVRGKLLGLGQRPLDAAAHRRGDRQREGEEEAEAQSRHVRVLSVCSCFWFVQAALGAKCPTFSTPEPPAALSDFLNGGFSKAGASCHTTLDLRQETAARSEAHLHCGCRWLSDAPSGTARPPGRSNPARTCAHVRHTVVGCSCTPSIAQRVSNKRPIRCGRWRIHNLCVAPHRSSPESLNGSARARSPAQGRRCAQLRVLLRASSVRPPCALRARAVLPRHPTAQSSRLGGQTLPEMSRRSGGPPLFLSRTRMACLLQ